MMLHKTGRSSLSPRGSFILAALLFAGLPPLSAQTVTPNDSGSLERRTVLEQPWFPQPLLSDDLVHDPGSTSMSLAYLSRTNCNACLTTYRTNTNSYVLFDVPSSLNNVATVELRFRLTIHRDLVEPGTEWDFNWQAWDVGSPPAAFQVAYSGTTTAAGLALFSDLQSGIQYGSGQTRDGGAVAFTFEGASLTDLLAARGSVFGIGFTTPGLIPNMYGEVTASLADMQLVVTTIPEPATGATMLMALGAMTAALRRRGLGPFDLARGSAVAATKRATQ
jgi:PEP-CTERM motif